MANLRTANLAPESATATTPGSRSLTQASENDDIDIIDIDARGKLDLPPLPVLKSEKDLNFWLTGLNAHFELLELEKFLTIDIQEPTDMEKRRKWLRCRRFIMVHLLRAISQGVQKDIEILGWDKRDPFNTVQTAKRAVSRISSDSIRQLLDAWNHLNAKRFQNLKEFIQHIQAL